MERAQTFQISKGAQEKLERLSFDSDTHDDSGVFG